jgi:hypothetical protein
VGDDDRFSRNIALFGREGQRRIGRERVGVVGLGGLGSHVAQQLSYLGAGDLTYVDDDVVTPSSLNRVVTAVESDPGETAKIEAAARMTGAVARTAFVTTVRAKLQAGDALNALVRCTSIFGCLDDDLSRVALIELCARNRIPFFDLATDTGSDASGTWYGGRVLFSGEGDRCPSCMDLLDQQAMARAAMSDEQRDVDNRLYGVARDVLDATGPAVVSLNGIVASLGVMEWMVWITGLREPRPLLEYRGGAGVVFGNTDAPVEGCYYCGLWKAQPLRGLAVPPYSAGCE